MQIDRALRRLFLDPSEPAFVQDPYPAYALARAAGPALVWEQYGHWCLFDHAGVSAALRDRRLGRQVRAPDPVPPHLQRFHEIDRLAMLDREPPAHTRLRGLVTRAFVSARVERLRPRIEALAHRLVDGFAAAGRVELIGAFATIVPVTLIAELLGVPVSETGRLLEWSHRMVAMYRIGRTALDERRAAEATDSFVAFLQALVAERRRQPRDDLISRLIAVRDEAGDDRLSEPELIANCILLLNAGHEATVHAIGNGVHAVLRSGLDPAALFATAEATAATVEELLRLDTPLHLFTRTALEDLELPGGVMLRRGEPVGLVLGAANHDPAAYPEPGRLCLHRTGPLAASFGGGIHFCLGAPLARLELQAVLPILFGRLGGVRLVRPPLYADSYHFRGLAALDLAFTDARRSPPAAPRPRRPA